MELKNKVAIITGGARGIGWACVEKFSEKGAQVVIFDLEVDRVKEEMANKKIQGLAMAVDITSKEQIEHGVKEVIKEYGKIDILVNNAGIFRDVRLVNMSEEDWDTVMNVNLKGLFFVLQTVAPYMIENKYGKVVNLSSIAYKGNFGQANYSASKAGVVSLTKTASLELAPYITVNCVAPGTIDTPLLHSMDPKIKERMLKKVPLGRIGKQQDIANTVLFFASDASSYITGTVLDVDGGMTQGLNLR
ncbi:NAD(P)-dependent dehydrogenase (short-subunit alcohol dehydrogenase family) [Neobacillus niacini]|uniref:SDR family NAD(P)-dependent oxidoreductase n=1 Tax=Neobacillus niacini TaxID=86668 RepID=UPI0027832215|nr:SDR family NAD(P)-dependent oxidoreductase [Neobacillus niacini]MDQ1005314.1 NAD(P)-dependent dehydrogenase (short-subunit alcohol dehydrogenase family) [Neobacillus niacini]